MNYPKYHIGPMSKNVVDAILEYTEETGNVIGIIPSRRQIEHSGGYVNNWTTKTFYAYINRRLPITRDHSGPSQGINKDDGYASLQHDCKYFNMIHIDPWIQYPEYADGLKWTIDMINFCYKQNQKLEYEIGTEESIRKFEAFELDRLMINLRAKLPVHIFNRIKCLVVQSGTSLKGNTNTGKYSKDRLKDMIEVAGIWNLYSKEHNGDYISTSLIKEKFDLGLDAINIAPEFGQIETKTYLDKIKQNSELFGILYKICYISNKWKKWVDKDFDPIQQKEELINICGHYILSDSDFLLKVKSKFTNIDLEIKNNIKIKLQELHG